MKIASEYDCGNDEDTPKNSVNLMNIYRKYIGPESVTSLDNCSLPSSAQQLQQKKKLSTTQKTFGLQAPSLFFAPFFTMSRDEVG